MIDTKEKLLDTAEALFAEDGYASTSLRQIINKAEVNLAAVHYHFGSKEELLDALVQRKVEAVNQERIARLERLEGEMGGRPIAIEDILEAYLMPAANGAVANPQFVRLMGRIHAEGLMPGIVQKHFHPTAKRFLAALRPSLPHLSEAEFGWRVHFMMGAMAHTFCVAPAFPVPQEDFHGRMRKLISFLSAGFRAAATKEGQ
jgi:AcrR family transcriptional regulator